MSWRAEAWAWEREDLNVTAKAVLLTLARHADERGYTWPSANRIAFTWGMDRETVRRQIDLLLVRRLISRTNKRCGMTGQVKVFRLPKCTWERGGKSQSFEHNESEGKERDKSGIRGGKSSTNNDNDKEKRIINDNSAREKRRSRNAASAAESNGAKVSVSLPLWVLKEKKKYPQAQDHPKWQEFADWCSTKRDGRGRPGKPTEKGFSTWLSKQKEKWRSKVKTRKDELAQTPPWKLQKLRDKHLAEVNQLYQPVKDFHRRHLLSKEKRADIERRYKAYLPRRDELRGRIREIDEVIKANKAL
jgi:hypothetical protein